MVRCLLFFCMLCAAIQSQAARSEVLNSPDGRIKVEVDVADSLFFSVSRDGEALLAHCPLFLQVDKRCLGVNPKLKSAVKSSIRNEIRNRVAVKNAVTPDRANVLSLSFQGGYEVQFRAYDNGVAYRFLLKGKGSVQIAQEGLALRFPKPFNAHISKTPSGFWTSYEYPYVHLSTAEYGPADEMTYLPVLFDTDRGTKVLFSESDVRDYPNMFLKPTDGNGFTSIFPRSPETWEPRGDRSWTITKERDCIALTDAQRTLPWRFAVIGEDKDIAQNQMEVVLGGKCQIADTQWIRPGKVSWDWWNHWTIWDVDFVTGINNDTYKYFIDFASRYGVEYILLDEGWCKDVRDPYTMREGIDVRELVEYGRQKGVGVILWLSWLTVEQHMELIKHYADMGVKGLKIDFMDHSDQWMVNYYERVAKECAANKLIVDFHGSFKPAGLEIRYPNVISYEGVRGLEQGAGCHPDNTIWLPFIRNAVGPMDFTPGSMASAQPEDNKGTASLPVGSGTRAYQMALYVTFESALQMLADSPTRYMREDECTRFIASVPTTWDESRVLSAEAGRHYVVARRKGNKWFIGAITGSQQQDISVPLSFLGGSGKLVYFQDGVNADRIAVDYRKGERQVSPSETLQIHLARNGGWCGVITQ